MGNDEQGLYARALIHVSDLRRMKKFLFPVYKESKKKKGGGIVPLSKFQKFS